jgi:2-keto-4-pentenoate hydratase/2-oxohepta-3-ene-1,7-dioic acid hydratase in catechol pathway
LRSDIGPIAFAPRDRPAGVFNQKAEGGDVRLALFNEHVPGLVAGDRIVDVADVVGPAVMALRPAARARELIACFDALRPALAEAASRPGKPLSDVQLRAPLPRPGKILVGLSNYREGVDAPLKAINMAMKSPSSVIDPGGVVELPPQQAVVFHHEAQLVAVIGKPGKDIAQDRALEHVLGYTSAINVNARGLGYGLGIDTDSFDTFTPLGPWIVTRDEIPDPQVLTVTLRQDGQLREDYSTADMAHPIAELIAFASRLVGLEPGDLIFAGARYQGQGPVQHGETAELEIGPIGRLSVRFNDPLARRWPKGVDAGLAKAAQDARAAGTPIPFKTASIQQLA